MRCVASALLTASLFGSAVSGSALAADMPVKAPPPTAAYDWTGFYVGGNAGYGFGSTQYTAVSGASLAPSGFVFNRADLTGAVGGGQIGYNYQIGKWVLGAEGEYSFANIRGSETSFPPGPPAGATSTGNPSLSWLATATARGGYVWDSTLFYLKGGAAWTRAGDFTVVTLASGALAGTASAAANRAGWTIGTGIEYAASKNWSARLEYDYLGFGTSTVTGAASTGATEVRNVQLATSMIAAGVNYRFSVGP